MAQPRSSALTATPPPETTQPGIEVPIIHLRLRRPPRGSLAWYVGLGAMAALEVIEWPVALVVGATHALATSTRDPQLEEFLEGAEEAGA